MPVCIATSGVTTCRASIRYAEYAHQHFLTYQAHTIAERGNGREPTWNRYGPLDDSIAPFEVTECPCLVLKAAMDSTERQF